MGRTRSWLPLVALLAGCAGPGARPPTAAPPYQAPAHGAQATLLLRVTQPGGQYSLSTFENPVSCSRRRELASGTEREPERVARQVPAGKLQSVSFLYRNTNRQACEVILSFEPARGRTYLVRNVVEAKKCSMELVDITSPNQPAPVPRMQRTRLGYGLLDEACQPITSTAMPAPAGTATRDEPSLDAFRDLLPTK